MTVSAGPTRHPQEHQAVTARLSTLDRFLPVWIGLAMAAGIGLGALLPRLDDWLDELRVGTVSLPIAIGLLLMMYPVLAKVRYEELGQLRRERSLFGASLVLNWVVGPALMFADRAVRQTCLPDSRSSAVTRRVSSQTMRAGNKRTDHREISPPVRPRQAGANAAKPVADSDREFSAIHRPSPPRSPARQEDAAAWGPQQL